MDLKELMKMAGASKEEGMGDDKVKAKMRVIHDLREMASDMMSEGLDEGLKKVTVASDDEEGLKEGLEMAEDIVEEGAPESDSYGIDDYHAGDSDDMSADDIEAKIAELMEMKRKMMEG